MNKAFNHYFKDVSNLETVDVYRVLELFNVVNPCVQHAIKKLLCAGLRGKGSQMQDLEEAINASGPRIIQMQKAREQEKA